MKKILFAAAAFCAVACTTSVPNNECQVSIQLEGLGDTALVMVLNAEMNNYDYTDTIYAKDGKYTYTATLEETRMALIAKPEQGHRARVILIPGQKLDVTGTLEEYHMGGSQMYVEIDEASSLTDSVMEEMNKLQEEFQQRVQAGEEREAVGQEIQGKYAALVEKAQKIQTDYLEAHPASAGSVMLLANMDTEAFGKYDEKIDQKVKEGPMAAIYNQAKSRYEKEQARLAAKEKLTEGAEAPDFELEAIDGGKIKLSDLRGKYVIIDFWGSWCGWCIKGMPDMKRYYEKYGKKLEILGVDCRDTDEKWRAAVEEHKLTWKHVKNGEGDADITTMYAIEGYPTKVILDPEGKIVKYVVGEDPEFYTILDNVLK